MVAAIAGFIYKVLLNKDPACDSGVKVNNGYL